MLHKRSRSELKRLRTRGSVLEPNPGKGRGRGAVPSRGWRQGAGGGLGDRLQPQKKGEAGPWFVLGKAEGAPGLGLCCF